MRKNGSELRQASSCKMELDWFHLGAFSASLSVAEVSWPRYLGFYSVLDASRSQQEAGFLFFNKYITPCESFIHEKSVLLVASLSLRLRRCLKISCVVGWCGCGGLDSCYYQRQSFILLYSWLLISKPNAKALLSPLKKKNRVLRDVNYCRHATKTPTCSLPIF